MAKETTTMYKSEPVFGSGILIQRREELLVSPSVVNIGGMSSPSDANIGGMTLITPCHCHHQK